MKKIDFHTVPLTRKLLRCPCNPVQEVHPLPRQLALSQHLLGMEGMRLLVQACVQYIITRKILQCIAEIQFLNVYFRIKDNVLCRKILQ
jgi:hypothetical protein